jgi:hypothetical protein
VFLSKFKLDKIECGTCHLRDIYTDACIDFNHTREPSPAWIIVYDLEFDLKPASIGKFAYMPRKKG